ncbi:MAG: hypothetical protein RL701_4619, partial [Pseudomonadota bacterium]
MTPVRRRFCARSVWSVWSCGFIVACATTEGAVDSSSRLEAAAFYAADGGKSATATDRAFERALQQVAEVQGLTLRPDARLDRLAAWAAADTETISATRLEFAARRLGLYDPQFTVFNVAADASLSAAILRELATQPYTHCGIAFTQTSRAHTPRHATLVLSRRRIQLNAVPSSVAVGVALHLRGHMPSGFSNARVELISAAGRVVVPLGAARELSVQLPTTQPGLHRLSVIADSASGDEVLAKLPIYVGTPFPDAIFPKSDRSYDYAAIARSIFESINRERERAGLPLLQRDSRLDSLALQHNADMRTHEFIGHNSAQTGSPTERVARAGLPTALVLETIARAAAPNMLEASGTAPAGEVRNLLSSS